MKLNLQGKQVLAALLIGCLIGIVIGVHIQRGAYQRAWRQGPNPERLMKRLTGELGLDAAQKDAVRAIIGKQKDQVVALHQEVDAKFDAIRGSMHDDIRKVLTPDQQKKFDDLVAKWNARRRKVESAPDAKGSPADTNAK